MGNDTVRDGDAETPWSDDAALLLAGVLSVAAGEKIQQRGPAEVQEVWTPARFCGLSAQSRELLFAGQALQK